MYKINIFSFVLLALISMGQCLYSMEGNPAVKEFEALIGESNRNTDESRLLQAINSITGQLEELSNEDLQSLLLFLGRQVGGLEASAIQVQQVQGNSNTTTQESSFWDGWTSQDDDDYFWTTSNSEDSSSQSSSRDDDGDRSSDKMTAVVIVAAAAATVACLLWLFCRKSNSDDLQTCLYAQNAVKRLVSFMEVVVVVLKDRDQVAMIETVKRQLGEVAKRSPTLKATLSTAF